MSEYLDWFGYDEPPRARQRRVAPLPRARIHTTRRLCRRNFWGRRFLVVMGVC